ncbi:27866_t:CDS:2 [Dentiscutata erythropus]|uniref:27866_t:CDS:1 n=1 Tax=Dentiscutata erythropus TaxID=1348616 RepID=A0A9N9DQH8_9GLOM|nr:27866_t:CDS:2 [Dentiscutata erythropus]
MSQSERATQIRTAIKDVGIKFIEYSSLKDITSIGRGGFGEIFKAFWPQPGITVALKYIDSNRDPYKAFIKEVKSLMIVNYHENIIRFLGVSFEVVERLNNIERVNQSDFILPKTPPSSPMDTRSITLKTHLVSPLSITASNKNTSHQPSLIRVFEPPTRQEMNNKNPFH